MTEYFVAGIAFSDTLSPDRLVLSGRASFGYSTLASEEKASEK